MSDRFVLPLESCSDPVLVGGKAAGLGRLLRNGFHVPRGVCLTTLAYSEALHAAGVNLSRQWARVRRASDRARGPMLEEFRLVVQSLTVPQAIFDRLEHEIDRLGMVKGTLWAVRSSASDEDQTNASFGGLYRSILGVPRSSITAAIVECWASLWTLAALAYRGRIGWGRTDPAMAVLLQPLLSPRAAGVAYSRHPVTAQGDLVMINAVFGLAEPLVGGMVTSDQYVVKIGDDDAPGTVLERDIAEKTTARVVTPAGLVDQPLSEEDRKTTVLEELDILALADLVKRVERTMGEPVDVEWAIDSRGIWLLQARLIPDVGLSQDLTKQSCEWSRANFKETLPELPSPLGVSFLQEFMEHNILRHYRELGCSIPHGLSAVRMFRGRPYINVTLFQSFMRQLGGDPALVIEQMGGEGRLLQDGPPRLAWWKLIQVGVLMERKIRQAARRAPAWFVAMKEMATVHTDDSMKELGPTELLDRLDQLGHRFKGRDVTFAIVAGVSQGLQALRFLLKRWMGPGWQTTLNTSLQGLGNVISARQILWLAELAEHARDEPRVEAFLLAEPWAPEQFRVKLAGTRFLEEFGAYLAEYGHRAIGESDLMSPRFIECPEYLLGVVGRHLQGRCGRSVKDVLRQQESAREGALEQIHRALGWRLLQRAIFQWWYRRLCHYLALREANRHHLMHFSAAVRHLTLLLGEKWSAAGTLESKDDVFFLTAEEMRTAGAGSAQDWGTLVAARRAERVRNAEQVVPDLVSPAREVPLDADNWVMTSGLWHGVPISAGYVEGPVCIVLSPADTSKMKQDDILVMPVIDPGMAPLLGLAAGLVVEMGGTLSHGAIIAREYGLPTIANVRQVTRLLKDGDRVAVDATAGTVTRLDDH